MSKIVGFTYLRTFRPGGSSGTGYSEPSYWNVEIELSPGIRINKEVCIDLWYRPSDLVYEQYREGLNSVIKKYGIINYDEVFYLFFQEVISNYGHPYKWEDVKAGREKYLERLKRMKREY